MENTNASTYCKEWTVYGIHNCQKKAVTDGFCKVHHPAYIRPRGTHSSLRAAQATSADPINADEYDEDNAGSGPGVASRPACSVCTGVGGHWPGCPSLARDAAGFAL